MLAQIKYLDGGGTERTALGSWAATSTATSQTLQVTGRAVNVKVGSTTTGFYSY